MRESIGFLGWVSAFVFWLPLAWFTIGPVWGPWWLLFVLFFLVGFPGKLLLGPLVVCGLIAALPSASAQSSSGWGAFDASRGEVYDSRLFATETECSINLARYRPHYGNWQCRRMEFTAPSYAPSAPRYVPRPDPFLNPPANARGGVQCSKSGGTTVCR